MTEQLVALKKPIQIQEFQGLVPYKGLYTSKYYFITTTNYTRDPLKDSLKAVSLTSKVSSAFNNGIDIPDYVMEML